MKVAILILTLFLISCDSNDLKTDTDTVPDKDSALNDADTETVDDLSDGVLTESDDISDADSEAECIPPLIDAPFPYYDNDGNITFCRPGCDTPTEKDPQCMSNLWKEQNQALCKQKPKYDCCGYPCVMESFKPMTQEETDKELVFEGKILVPMHKCDLFLSLWDNDGTHGVVKSWNMSEEKIGFHLVPTGIDILEWPNIRKAVTYDIETKKYFFIAPGDQMQAYHKGKRILLSGDKRPLPIDTRKKYLTYMGDDGSLGIVYPEAVEFLAYEPALNDKWAFVNLTTKGNSSRMMYAKVGNPSSNSTADSWKWTVLGEGTARYSDLYDDKLGIYDENKNGYICDLSKSPASFSECKKINRDNESVSIIRINRNNSEEFVYNSNRQSIVKGKIVNGNIEYENIITEFDEETEKYGYTISPYQLRGNILLYVQVTNNGSESGGLLCYYRIDKKKKYCMKKMENDAVYPDGTTRYPYGFSEFEGKWLLYQKINSTPLILRDMECYCKEEGICPFEE